MSLDILQHYWWLLIAILGGALVLLLFVQGGQSLLYTLGKTKEERSLITYTLGSKWELTFTTLVVFGGAFFASFPLFYSTSFGGAYAVWMLILLSFVLQAVSYEFRSKENNLLGQKAYDYFLIFNGYAAPILLGAAVATFFTGSPFRLNTMNQMEWMTPWRGLDALFVFTNYTLAFAVFFLSRVLACLYFKLNIDNQGIRERLPKQLLLNSALFLLSFLLFLGLILTSKGYGLDATGKVALVPYKYFLNLIEMPINTLLLLLGVIAVLYGIIKAILQPEWNKGIWFTGSGTVLTVIALFILVGYNQTSFYPSNSDISSSLTIHNASSSLYTLEVMSYVSLITPFVIAYIWYTWKQMTKKSVSVDEINDEHY